ncbi:gluconokinase [Kitasatospora sp. NBC_01250]|uniref:gluconokinase n=1 Tax=unclassified Kitasatospora TaxID=2633591 RepID=UPI002E140ABE|nr:MULTISPECIES: gluconokinase [unclassified Kitasatospora]WSJ65745.1 gluconokinase [Kitasatospora sp. NBC_01302]
MATKRADPPRRTTILVVLGVSGSGKSTVAAMLAERLGLSFLETDDLHTPQDRARMAAGHPLADADRWPWLGRVTRWMDEQIASGASGVVACSALKRSYRDYLRDGRPEVRLLYLQGSRELIASRLAARRGHFFPVELLASQFEDFEEPAADEHPYVVPLAGSPEQTVARALELLGADGLRTSPDS